jgi:hypothetical protein
MERWKNRSSGRPHSTGTTRQEGRVRERRTQRERSTRPRGASLREATREKPQRGKTGNQPQIGQQGHHQFPHRISNIGVRRNIWKRDFQFVNSSRQRPEDIGKKPRGAARKPISISTCAQSRSPRAESPWNGLRRRNETKARLDNRPGMPIIITHNFTDS